MNVLKNWKNWLIIILLIILFGGFIFSNKLIKSARADLTESRSELADSLRDNKRIEKESTKLKGVVDSLTAENRRLRDAGRSIADRTDSIYDRSGVVLQGIFGLEQSISNFDRESNRAEQELALVYSGYTELRNRGKSIKERSEIIERRSGVIKSGVGGLRDEINRGESESGRLIDYLQRAEEIARECR